MAKLTEAKAGWVQLDLLDLEHMWAFESKVNYRGYEPGLEEQAQAQASLVDKGFLNGVTWISMPNDLGQKGFSPAVWRDILLPLGIESGYWTYGMGIRGMTFY
ncbi:MAG: hypothetical protein ABSG45_00830 [Nitrososphaerales archaeon]